MGHAERLSDGDLLRAVHGVGPVQEVFGGPHLQALTGQHAIGQVVRVATGAAMPGVPAIRAPLVARYKGGQIAVAMAGRFTNGPRLREDLKAEGALFTTTSDTEVLLHLLARSEKSTLVNRLVDALWQVLGRGGKLLYATCSVFHEENHIQVERFLDRHRDARRLPLPGDDTTRQEHAGQILPDDRHDGFFYALLQKD